MVAFGVVGMLLWGTISSDFSVKGSAFISVIALALGHFDSKILDAGNIYITAVILTLYYFFLIFFLITVFTSIMIDTYRVVKMERSAQESDKKQEFSNRLHKRN